MKEIGDVLSDDCVIAGNAITLSPNISPNIVNRQPFNGQPLLIKPYTLNHTPYIPSPNIAGNAITLSP